MSTEQLPPLLVAGRVERLREQLARHPVDALLVHRLVDIRWLTGFTGTAATVFVGPDELASQRVRMKDLATGDQTDVPLGDEISQNDG